MMHAWRNGFRNGPNTKQFYVTGSPQIARPKPDTGLAIDPTAIDREVRQMLASFTKDQWVVGAVIFDDSFADFQSLKAAIVKAGYEYSLYPLRLGESINDSGGSSAEAQ
ncbi:MAG: hypothetical protein NTV56_19200 [Alphaproteobacteria bacterium]|nr:hypothetical protein [Alphaproteobacteria bacterium]